MLRRIASKPLETTVTPVQLECVGRDSLEYLQIQESRVLGASCHARHAIQEKEVQAPVHARILLNRLRMMNEIKG